MVKINKINFVKFMQGLTLLILAIVLTFIATIISFVYTIFLMILTLKFQTGINDFGDYLAKMALSIDQFGNVSCASLLQFTLSKKDAKHKFGDEDDTISYGLGRLKYQNKLTFFGKCCVFV